MATTIPYTWTPEIKVIPTDGIIPFGYFRDDSAPGYIPGVQYALSPVPWWLALDFTYTASGRLLVLMSAPTEDAQRGRLRVYRSTDSPTAAELTEYTELESNQVNGAAFGCRGDLVDVFYNHGGELKWRLSEDGGVTFGPAVPITLTAPGKTFTPDQCSYAGVTGINVSARTAGGFVAFTYLAAGRGIALIATGNLTGDPGPGFHIAPGEWDGDANRWTFGPTILTSNFGTAEYPGRYPNPTGISCLRSGDPIIWPSAQLLRQFSQDGTFTVHGPDLSGGSIITRAVSEDLGQMLNTAIFDPPAPDNNPWNLRGWGVYRWDGATKAWVFSGASANSERWRVWQYLEGAGGHSGFNTKADRLKLRRDRVWEYLHLAPVASPSRTNPAALPTILRAPSGVPFAGTPVAWI